MMLSRIVFGFLLTGMVLTSQTADHKKKGPAHKSHVAVLPGQLKWGPIPAGAVQGTPPEGFPALRSEIAVVEGDPSKPGPFVIRLKSPDGEKIAPHWHPADEHLTVLQGVFILSSGEKYSDAGGSELTVGAYASVPKRMWHFGRMKGETILQVHGTGPFVVNFGPMPAPTPAKAKSE